MAGHGGGAWKVAYADFVTAMMAFFLVMWITGQSQEVKQSIAGYFQDPWGTSSENSAPASLLPSEMHGNVQSLDMPQKLPPGPKPGAADSDETDADNIAKSKWAQKRKVHFLQDGDRTTPALILSFDEASAELSEGTRNQLDRVIPGLLGKSNMIEVRGHSTRRPLPNDSPYRNLWELCYARCTATMTYLQDHGIEPERLRLSQSNAFEPLTRRLETTWQAENSRVEVFLLNEMAEELPGTREAKPPEGAKPDKTDGGTGAAADVGAADHNLDEHAAPADPAKVDTAAGAAAKFGTSGVGATEFDAAAILNRLPASE
jgi:chemotaxis protein MotB